MELRSCIASKKTFAVCVQTRRMTTKAEEYRRKAEEADRLAHELAGSAMAKLYGWIATRWREMAAQVERQNLDEPPMQKRAS